MDNVHILDTFLVDSLPNLKPTMIEELQFLIRTHVVHERQVLVSNSDIKAGKEKTDHEIPTYLSTDHEIPTYLSTDHEISTYLSTNVTVGGFCGQSSVNVKLSLKIKKCDQ